MIRYDLPTWANPPTVERAVEWLTDSMDEMDAHSGSSLRVVLDRLAEEIEADQGITDPIYRIARRATPTAKFGACSGDDVIYRSREAAEARLAKIVELQDSLVRCFPLTYAAAEYRIEQAEPAWEAA